VKQVIIARMGIFMVGSQRIFPRVLIAAVLCIAAQAQGSDELVGAFGDPDHLLFKGDSPFTARQMIQAVQADLELQLSASPSASLDGYLELLARRLRAGFMRSGYFRPVADVHADPATGYVVVVLDPGPRWKCGPVIVQGTHRVPPDVIVDCLTKLGSLPYFAATVDENQTSVSCDPGPAPSPQATPRWVAGDPAPFDLFRAAELTRDVRAQLATMGYFHPFVKVSVEPDGRAASKDASLVVNVIDEGPRAVLHKVKYEWLDRNSPEEMDQFLKVKSEEPIDLDRIYQMQRQLWESGRFLWHSISVERLAGDDTHVDLQVNLKEADHLPLVNEPLSQVDQALLRFGKWLLSAGDDGEDIVIHSFIQSGGGGLRRADGLGWCPRHGGQCDASE
jgi:hypothetical protein